MLTSAETQALGKVLHELVANAEKYGALSTPGGQVSVNWDRKPTEPAAVLEWRNMTVRSWHSKAQFSAAPASTISYRTSSEGRLIACSQQKVSRKSDSLAI